MKNHEYEIVPLAALHFLMVKARAVTLRLITYLAPSIPLELYQALAFFLEGRLGGSVSLVSEQRYSGPAPDDDPFAADEVDLGFMCAPCYLQLRDRQPSSVQLVGAAPLYLDARTKGRPVYFSEIVVRADSPYQSFDDFAGARWAFNDRRSLSGYISVLRRLADDSRGVGYLGRAIQAGSHLAALELVATGAAAFAAIDSASLNFLRDHRPFAVSSLRVLGALGPHPVQPVVARAALSPHLVAQITEALLDAHRDTELSARMRYYGVERFVPVGPESYDHEAVYGSALSWLGGGRAFRGGVACDEDNA